MWMSRIWNCFTCQNGLPVTTTRALEGPNPLGRTYNPNCDINGDDKIDVKDYYIVCKRYGETDPWTSHIFLVFHQTRKANFEGAS
jgi:hypothetical protein